MVETPTPDAARLAELVNWANLKLTPETRRVATAWLRMGEDLLLEAIAIARRFEADAKVSRKLTLDWKERAEKAEASLAKVRESEGRTYLKLIDAEVERDAAILDAKRADGSAKHCIEMEMRANTRAHKAETSLARLREALERRNGCRAYSVAPTCITHNQDGWRCVDEAKAALAGSGQGVSDEAVGEGAKRAVNTPAPTPAKPAEAAKCGALISGKEHRCGKPKGHAQDPNGGGCVCECELPKPPAPCPGSYHGCCKREVTHHCPSCPSKGA